jgi:DNA replication protein
MPSFSGFPGGKVHLTPIPAQFFTDLLPEIDHIGELKVTLYAIWFLDRQEGSHRYITHQDFAGDQKLMAGLGKDPAALDDALERAVLRGSLLKIIPSEGKPGDAIFVLNSPRGRATIKGFETGKFSFNDHQHSPVKLELERPNIFRLYEENIGPLTPLLSDILREAEKAYPPDWIEDAVTLAVQKNARNWRFVEAVLHTWQEKGRHEENRRNPEKDRRRYIEGEYADLIEH